MRRTIQRPRRKGVPSGHLPRPVREFELPSWRVCYTTLTPCRRKGGPAVGKGFLASGHLQRAAPEK
eukprot:9473192-Pyramimonas_sp.AAC.1